MSDYESIRGTRVKYLTSDPTLNSSTEGQVWYNSTTGANKALVQIKATSSGGNMGTARYGVGGAGTQTAGLAFTGSPGSSPYLSNATEEYSGFSWSSGGNYPVSTRYVHGAGTQTAALGFMSDIAPLQLSAEYDGSSWTAGNSLTVSRNRGGGSSNSTQTAGLAFGGNPLSNTTEEYDGTNWTAGGNLNTARRENPGAGTQTAGLAMGGKNAPSGNTTTTETEEYNGTSWTVVSGVLPTGTSNFNNGAGTQSDAALFGGQNSDGTKVNTIQEYDGSAWSNSSATLASNRSSAGIGTRAQGLIFGGLSTTTLNTTEEYNSNINAITQAVWSAGGTVNTVGDVSAGAGTMNAGLKFGGYPPSGGGVGTTATEEYNGSSWTSVNSMNTAGYGLTGTGLQTAAVRFGGYSGTNLNNTEEYNGTDWTAVTAVPTTLSSATSFGIQTAAVLAGGYDGSTWQQDALEYDGTSFSSGGTFPSTTGAQYAGSAGTQTAGLYFGGYIPGSALGVTTISYDGSSWTAANNMLISRYTSGSGTQTAALAPGGYQNANPLNPAAGYTLACEQYDGTNWSNTCNNNITRGYQISSNRASNAPGTTGLVFGGSNHPAPGNTNTSEEFTGGTEVVTASTLTTS